MSSESSSPESVARASACAEKPRKFFERGDWSLNLRSAHILAALVLSVVAGVLVVWIPAALVFGGLAAVLVTWVILARPYVGLVLYTCMFMLRPGEVYPILSVLHVERIVGILALIGMYVEQHRVAGRLHIDWTRQTRLLIVFIGAILISVPLAYWRSAAMDGLIDALKLLAWYLLVVHLVDTRRRLRVYLSLLLALTCYIAYDSYSAYLSGSFHYRMGIERMVGQTNAGGDPNALAATMAATIPLLLLLSFYRRLRWGRMITAAGLVLIVVTMSLTGSRSGLLGFLAGMVFLWVQTRHRVLAGAAGVVLIGLGLLALPPQYQNRYASIGSAELDGSSSTRLELWGKGLRMFADHPLVGVGIGCYAIANAMDYSPPSNPDFMVSHSLYIQVPSELGTFGVLAFAAFMIAVIRLNRRTARGLGAAGPDWDFERIVLRGMLAGIFALFVTGIFGDNLMRYTWYLYAAVAAAIARIYADRRVTPEVQGWSGQAIGARVGGGPSAA
ncbi:MAG: O-antigen ligase family protein [Candidatus Eisenbacteria bacterium]